MAAGYACDYCQTFVETERLVWVLRTRDGETKDMFGRDMAAWKDASFCSVRCIGHFVARHPAFEQEMSR